MKKLGAALAAVISIFFLLFYASNVPKDEFVDNYGTDYGAVLVLNFEEGTGTTTFDQSPFGNDGVFSTPPADWLPGGYDYRIKFTLDSGDIDEVLTDFPFLLNLSSSCGINNEDLTLIFDEVGANWRKIAITTSDGTTECYVEVPYWDAGLELAELHVKGPSLSNTSDPEFYFYFDNDVADNVAHVGDPDDAVTHNVWNVGYEFVSHMRDDPDTSHIRDSTVNANDGTKKGANEPIVTTAGMIDEAQDFDGTDDNIAIGTGTHVDTLTFEVWLRTDDVPFGNNPILSHDVDAGATLDWVMYGRINTKYLRFRVDTAGGQKTIDTGDVILSPVTKYYVVGWYDGTTLKIYVDGIEEASDTHPAPGNIRDTANARYIGTNYLGQYPWDGMLDEMRISTVRTPAWINASYESGWDHLVDFGSVESAGITSPTWTDGKYGEAIGFAATSTAGSYITIGDVSSSLRTMWFWIKLNSTSEPVLQLKTGVYINVTDGVLSATGFAGTTTFYVDGEETTTIASGEWHHVAVVSDANEDCSALEIGRVGVDYLTADMDQLRAFTVSKTAAEVGVQYLDPTGGMYSGSVIVSDRLLVLNSSLDPQLTLEDGHLNVAGTAEFGEDVDMNLNYILYFPLETSLTHAVGPGVTDVELLAIPAGMHTQDVHYWMFMISLDNPPGDGKIFNASISDGTNTIYCWISGAVDKEVQNMTGAFDLDVSAETLTVAYSQTAGGAVTEVHTMRHWWYKENE